MILKPHGSLNWLICEKCKKIYRYKKEKITAYLNWSNNSNQNPECFKCHIPLKNPIVTPSYIQNVQKSIYKKIWKEIENIINNSFEITIIGYTLPEADKEFRQIVRKSIFGNFSNLLNNKYERNLERLTIIVGTSLKEDELKPNKKDEINKNWNRFYSFFGKLIKPQVELFWPFGFKEYFYLYLHLQPFNGFRDNEYLNIFPRDFYEKIFKELKLEEETSIHD